MEKVKNLIVGLIVNSKGGKMRYEAKKIILPFVFFAFQKFHCQLFSCGQTESNTFPQLPLLEFFSFPLSSSPW